jgi:hypothetical protein
MMQGGQEAFNMPLRKSLSPARPRLTETQVSYKDQIDGLQKSLESE